MPTGKELLQEMLSIAVHMSVTQAVKRSSSDRRIGGLILNPCRQQDTEPQIEGITVDVCSRSQSADGTLSAKPVVYVFVFFIENDPSLPGKLLHHTAV